jgi:hypothetical protein
MRRMRESILEAFKVVCGESPEPDRVIENFLRVVLESKPERLISNLK